MDNTVQDAIAAHLLFSRRVAGAGAAATAAAAAAAAAAAGEGVSCYEADNTAENEQGLEMHLGIG